MIEFEFLPRADDPSWGKQGLAGRPAHTLTANDFTFHCFNADVVISDDEKNIHLKTPGLPVVDFVLMLVQLYREVVESGESSVESSQSQDSISALRRGDEVEITYSFSGTVTRVPFDQFGKVPQRALQSALAVLNAAHGDLIGNQYLTDLANLVLLD
ncbi:hypothetical protein [Streptomyces chrestomyceticus]|uniref:hypothetical protein n=1 Tax=Streptomyces chrestomyceticus TaxID=68185 RepID=UPI0019D2CA18|nr:hypothetical protein [Streptomyces chrestomyceticus]